MVKTRKDLQISNEMKKLRASKKRVAPPKRFKNDEKSKKRQKWSKPMFLMNYIRKKGKKGEDQEPKKKVTKRK